MVRSLFVCVADDPQLVQKLKELGQSLGVRTEAYSPSAWSQGLDDAHFRQNLGGEAPTLVAGGLQGGKVLQFPGPGSGVVSLDHSDGVSTINQLEAKAIENAINTFRGNLTEAAKALGIGRATLYRKVKLYNIDPANARRRKMAA